MQQQQQQQLQQHQQQQQCLPNEIIHLILSNVRNITDMKNLRLTSKLIKEYIDSYWVNFVRVKIMWKNYQQATFFLSQHEEIKNIKVVIPTYRKIYDSLFTMKKLLRSIPTSSCNDIVFEDDTTIERRRNSKIKRIVGLDTNFFHNFLIKFYKVFFKYSRCKICPDYACPYLTLQQKYILMSSSYFKCTIGLHNKTTPQVKHYGRIYTKSIVDFVSMCKSMGYDIFVNHRVERLCGNYKMYKM